MHLVVGLGNPGPRYSGTRHNAGFRVVEALSRRLPAGRPFHLSRSLCAEARRPGGVLLLAQPLTYMNLSGRAVTELFRRYKVKLEDFLLVHDDLDLPLGTLRLKKGGGAGGHRGVQSVAELLGTPEFARLRFGIGRPAGAGAADYVLERFASAEEQLLADTVERAVQAVLAWMDDGLERAANLFNRAPGPA